MKSSRIITIGMVSALLGLLVAAAALLLILRPTSTQWWSDGQSIRVRAESIEPRDVLFAPPLELNLLEPDEIDRYAPALSPDASTLWFVRGRPGGSADLWSARRTAAGWGKPQPATALNTEADELGPALSPDGASLYFHSDRAGGAGGYDLWVSTRTAEGTWSSPVNLGNHVNGPWHEYGAAADASGLWFASNRPRPGDEPVDVDDAWSATLRADRAQRDFDLYRSANSERGLEPAQPITALNTESDEGSPALSPAGDFVYFASNRPGGEGGFDLYRAGLEGSSFRATEPLGAPVNTPGNELDPALDFGGFRLLYSHSSEAGLPYRVLASDSREVRRETETISASVDWAALLPALWWLLAALLAALLLWALRHLLRRRIEQMGLVGRALIASALVHLLLLFLLTAWGVGHSISNWSRGGQQVRLTSPSVGQSVGTQLRGAVPRKMTSIAPLPVSEVTPLTASLLTATPAPFHTSSPDNLAIPTATLTSPPSAPSRAAAAPAPGEAPGETPTPEFEIPAPTEAVRSAFNSPTSNAAPPVAESTAAATPFRSTDRPAAVQPETLAAAARPVVLPTKLDPAPLPANALPASGEIVSPATTALAVPTREMTTSPPLTIADSPAPEIPETTPPRTASETPRPQFVPDEAITPRPANSGAIPIPVQTTPTERTGGTIEPPPIALRVERLPNDTARPAPNPDPTTDIPPLTSHSTETKIATPPSTLAPYALPSNNSRLSHAEITSPPIKIELPKSLTAIDAAPFFTPPPHTAAPTPQANRMPSAAPLPAPPLLKTPSPEIAPNSPAPTSPHSHPLQPLTRTAPAHNNELLAVQLPTRRADPSESAPPTPPSPADYPDPVRAQPERIALAQRALPAPPLVAPEAPAQADPLGPDRAFPGAIPLTPANITLSPAAASPLTTPPLIRSIETPAPAPPKFALDLPRAEIPPENPYEHRQESHREQLALEMGGTKETEAAVALALKWLARYQHENGSWDSDGFDLNCRCGDPSRVEVDIAVTALATLCFLACDHRPDRDGEYRETVERALDWLIARQEPNGALLGRESMYSHGIATLALSEAYAMTGQPELREPVERAVEFIVRAISPQGGWRYAPGQMGDTSVLGWQIMALASAQRGGITVPDHALNEGRRWLQQVEDRGQPGRYGYQPNHPVSPTMTAEGMFVQQLLGALPSDSRQQDSASYLMRSLPDAQEPNSYYWYYGTLALYQHQGAAWSAWNTRVRDVLVATQRTDGNAAGSWDATDQWAVTAGRVYQTAICTLTLEVYYRYLPSFLKTAGADQPAAQDAGDRGTSE